MTKLTEEFVTVKHCQAAHGILRWIIGILFGSMGLFTAMVGWSISASSESIKATIESTEVANKVEARLNVREARQDEIDKHIILSIDSMKIEMTKLNNNITDLTTKLWNQKKP